MLHATTTMTPPSGSPWQPLPLDAEFSPEVAAMLLSPRELSSILRRRGETLKTKLRKHLLALGWTILSRRSGGTEPRLRVRYDSPADGKTYPSLPQLVDSIDAAANQEHQKIHPPPAPSRYACDKKEEEEEEDQANYTVSPEEEEEEVEQDDQPDQKCGVDAVAEYIRFIAVNDRAKGPLADQLRASAKRHLESAGWTFWMKLKSNGREELRYKSPTGRSYISLHTACVAFQSDNSTNKLKRKPYHQLLPTVIKKSTTTKKRKTSEELLCAGGGTLIKKKSSATTTTKKRKKKNAAAASKAHVLRPRGKDGGESQPSACHRRATTLLSVLMDKNILLPRDKLTYRAARDGPPVKEGLITGDGVKCTCCNKAYTAADFQAHAAGSGNRADRPWARLFLKDGRSLAQCLLQLMRRDNGMTANASLRVRLKKKCTDMDGDSVCYICNDGGELLLCSHCPSAFHHDCVGLQAIPEGDWFCPSCRCGVCDHSDFDPDTSRFTDKTMIYCDQCEREYHAGCVRNRGDELKCCPEGPWLCSADCSKIFQYLQGLAGRSILTPVEGVSLTILRSMGAHDRGDRDEEALAEQHGKLYAAFDVLHECFVTLIEPRTQSDLSADIVFNRESELRRLNFRGYYIVGLEKGGELITVGTLRVYGNKVAELPLVGTRFAHRRQAMCHLLMKELEKMLCELGVERLVLPAVPELLQTWTGSFGFKVMTHSDKLEIAEHTILCFQGTTMCQKLLKDAPAPDRQLKVESA